MSKMENKKKEMEKHQEMEINNKELINLINPIFKDKTKKQEIIQKLYPFFSLKVNSQGEIDREYSAVEKIDPEKIEIIEEYQYEEKMYDSKNKFLTNCKSVGLSNFDQKKKISNKILKILQRYIAFIPCLLNYLELFLILKKLN